MPIEFLISSKESRVLFVFSIQLHDNIQIYVFTQHWISFTLFTQHNFYVFRSHSFLHLLPPFSSTYISLTFFFIHSNEYERILNVFNITFAKKNILFSWAFNKVRSFVRYIVKLKENWISEFACYASAARLPLLREERKAEKLNCSNWRCWKSNNNMSSWLFPLPTSQFHSHKMIFFVFIFLLFTSNLHTFTMLLSDRRLNSFSFTIFDSKTVHILFFWFLLCVYSRIELFYWLTKNQISIFDILKFHIFRFSYPVTVNYNCKFLIICSFLIFYPIADVFWIIIKNRNQSEITKKFSRDFFASLRNYMIVKLFKNTSNISYLFDTSNDTKKYKSLNRTKKGKKITFCMTKKVSQST